MLIFGRFLIGIAAGITTQLVPLYISEISPDEIRGRLTAINQFAIGIGQLSASVVALAVLPSWRLMVGLSAFPAALQFYGIFFIPESPKWLIEQDRVKEASQVIEQLYQPEFVDQEMNELLDEAAEKQTTNRPTFGDELSSLFSTYRKCLIIGCGLMTGYRLTGLGVASYYGPQIFLAAGMKIGRTDP